MQRALRYHGSVIEKVRETFLVKIAAEFESAVVKRALHGGPGQASARLLAEGPGWRVYDVVCDHGPQDRPFEEQHSGISIAIVAGGSFQYRGDGGRELLTPGSLLLGQHGQYFECRHEHAPGDRCIAFRYDPEYFEDLVADAGFPRAAFNALRLPPLRELSGLISQACSGVLGSAVSWEELSLQLAGRTLALTAAHSVAPPDVPASSVARITRAIRAIECRPHDQLSLRDLAREARLSPYHFLRTFQQITGLTPHQYLKRSRLRQAAMQLGVQPERILNIAFDSGFGDVSNFVHAFRAEFGTSPREYRRRVRSGTRGGLEAEQRSAGG